MISHDYRCIFVHIPKTGGASIENALWPTTADRTEDLLWGGFNREYGNAYQTGGLQHLHASTIKEIIGQQIYEEYLTFSMVRNPWDKAVSQYLYMQHRSDLRTYLGMSPSTDFKSYLALLDKKTHVQWEPQTRFILDNNGEPLVDNVARFESYSRSINKIFNQLRVKKRMFGLLPRKLLHLNQSQRSHYSQYYDSESVDMVSHLYLDDIRYFNYEFELQ